MKNAVWGVLLLSTLVVTIVVARLSDSAAEAQQPNSSVTRQAATSSDQLIALDCDAGGGQQQVTLVDPKLRVMSVYHVNRTTGEIKLMSVRNVQWDLLMEEFNGTNPLPREIRSLLEQRQTLDRN